MPEFSKRSKSNLITCHPDIIKVCRELIKFYDFSVICGERDKEEQNRAYLERKTNVQYPNSKHNSKPSLAVDLVPYPVDWTNLYRFKEMWIRFDTLAKYMKECGKIDSEFIWGGDWNTLKDYPHIEIKS